MSLHAARSGGRYRVFVVLSDGECDEGTTWEAALFGAQHRLANLCAVVDYNGIQSFGRVEDVLGLEPFAEKWRAFGWDVAEVDGHDHDALRTALDTAHPTRPRAVIAHTIKGKGVSFMEDDLLWHYRNPNDEQLAQALEEVKRSR
jgi:transketolase